MVGDWEKDWKRGLSGASRTRDDRIFGVTVLQERTGSCASGPPSPLSAHTEEGKKELLFLSSANPAQLERLCAHL